MARLCVYRPACGVDGCGRAHHAVGYCSGHYDRVRKHGEPGPAELRPQRPPGTVPCTVDGCDRPHRAHGLCRAHFQRQLAHGDPGPAEIGRYGGGTCSIDGGAAPSHSLGMCKRCHDRQRRAQW